MQMYYKNEKRVGNAAGVNANPFPYAGNSSNNRTVLSLNSSRQPTTKHQLESQFMQRS